MSWKAFRFYHNAEMYQRTIDYFVDRLNTADTSRLIGGSTDLGHRITRERQKISKFGGSSKAKQQQKIRSCDVTDPKISSIMNNNPKRYISHTLERDRYCSVELPSTSTAVLERHFWPHNHVMIPTHQAQRGERRDCFEDSMGSSFSSLAA